MPDQSKIQTAVAQGGGQPVTAGGPVAPVFSVSGNPNTAYNVPIAPPQSNAGGQWWSQPPTPISPIVQALLNQTYGRTYPTVPTPAPVVTTPPVTTPGTTPPTTVPPVIAQPQGPRPRGGMSGGDDGFDGQYCVQEDMFIPCGLGHCYANEIEVGTEVLCHTPELNFHRGKVEAVGESQLVDCVELITEGSARLICSSNTPFTFVGASADLAENEWAHAEDMVDKLVYVKRGEFVYAEKVILVVYKGKMRVMPISFGGKSFPAGSNPEALIYSHNIYKIPGSGVNLVALRDAISQQFGVSFGNSAYITTAGQLAQMTPQQAMGYAGGQAYQPGGALYTGGNVATGPGTTNTSSGGSTTTSSGGTTTPPVDPEAPYGRDARGIPLLPPLPQPAPSSWWSNLFPHDADGTIDWQGLFLEGLGVPGGVINTSGNGAPIFQIPRNSDGSVNWQEVIFDNGDNNP